MDKRVLVTGATGFIAGHCIAELLQSGYTVRATVRDLANTAKRAHLAELARRLGTDIEFVAADLDGESGWAAAVSGCTYVMHVASPFPSVPPADDEHLIRPAVDGTLRVLRASAGAAEVRRVVVTSSVAAIAYGHERDAVRTEVDWSVPDRAPAYQKSKTLAERAAWDFMGRLPAEHQLELAVINPGLVLGPVQNATISTSHEPIRRLIAGEVPGSVRVGWSTVDVRDLAVAHRLAMESPQAAGNRYICAGEPVWMADFATMLAPEYSSRGIRVPTRVLPDWLVRTIALFDKGVRVTVPMLGSVERVDAGKARRELGWTMRPVRDSVLDTADSLLRHGVVAPPHPRRARSRASRRSAPDVLGT